MSCCWWWPLFNHCLTIKIDHYSTIVWPLLVIVLVFLVLFLLTPSVSNHGRLLICCMFIFRIETQLGFHTNHQKWLVVSNDLSFQPTRGITQNIEGRTNNHLGKIKQLAGWWTILIGMIISLIGQWSLPSLHSVNPTVRQITTRKRQAIYNWWNVQPCSIARG